MRWQTWKWYLLMAKKAPPTGLVRISCTYWASVDYHFCSENCLSEVLTSFPKNAQVVNLKNSDLDLIWRIHRHSVYFMDMILFWICPRKRKIIFRFGNPDLDFPKNPHPYITQSNHELRPNTMWKLKTVLLASLISKGQTSYVYTLRSSLRWNQTYSTMQLYLTSWQYIAETKRFHYVKAFRVFAISNTFYVNIFPFLFRHVIIVNVSHCSQPFILNCNREASLSSHFKTLKKNGRAFESVTKKILYSQLYNQPWFFPL